MKMIVVVALALVAVVAAGPIEKQVEILKSFFDQKPEGYNTGFETSDGTSVQSIGEVKQVSNDEGKLIDVLVTRGSYTYIGEDGKPVTIEYFADETGFHPQGDSIPKAARR